MNITDQAVEVFDALCEKIGVMIDWTQPDANSYLSTMVQKIANYELATSVVWSCIMLVIIGVLFHFAKVFHKKAQEEDWDYDSVSPWIASVLWIALAIVSFASIFVISHQIFDIVKCLTFPEKAVLDYLKSVADSMKK